MNVVIVESAAKAKAINKYLGSSYKVLASYGHVRDLPSKDGSVEPDKDFADALGRRWPLPEGDERDRRRRQKRRQADPGHRPRPRGRGHLLAHSAHPGGEEGAQEGPARRAGHLQRRHQAVRSRCVQGSRARSTLRWWRPTWRAGRSTTSWASRSRRCCGASCRAPARPAACSRWRCGSSATARPRSRPSRPTNTGPSRPCSPPRRARSSRPASSAIAGRKLEKLDLKDEASATAIKAAIEKGDFKVVRVEKKAVKRNPFRAVRHLDPADGRLAQARLLGQADHADSPSASTRASTSAARPWASSPTCEPTASPSSRRRSAPSAA